MMVPPPPNLNSVSVVILRRNYRTGDVCWQAKLKVRRRDVDRIGTGTSTSYRI
jgi:hypothetical protein